MAGGKWAWVPERFANRGSKEQYDVYVAMHELLASDLSSAEAVMPSISRLQDRAVSAGAMNGLTAGGQVLDGTGADWLEPQSAEDLYMAEQARAADSVQENRAFLATAFAAAVTVAAANSRDIQPASFDALLDSGTAMTQTLLLLGKGVATASDDDVERACAQLQDYSRRPVRPSMAGAAAGRDTALRLVVQAVQDRHGPPRPPAEVAQRLRQNSGAARSA